MKFFNQRIQMRENKIKPEMISSAVKATESRAKHNKPVFFLTGITEGFIDMTVIVTNPYMATFDADNEAREFLGSIGIKKTDIEEVFWHEIGRDLMVHELVGADERGYIHDANDILWTLDIRYEYNDKRWKEKIVEGKGEDVNSDESTLDSKTASIPGAKPLIEELRRIGRSDTREIRTIMQPVHYTVESDSASDREAAATAVIKTLIDVERLHSRKCMFFKATHFGGDRNEYEADLEQLYNEYVGGCAVIDLTEPACMEYLLEEGEVIGECIKKYADGVLTILLLAEQSEEIKDILVPYLKGMKFYPLLKTELKGKEAKDYITAVCKEKGIGLESKDLDMLNDREIYPASYVKSVLTMEIKRGITGEDYSEYSSLDGDAFQKQKAYMEDEESIDGNLFELVGQNQIMEEAKAIISRIKVEKALTSRGLGVDPGPLNFVFTGNPGTAKTTAAFLLAKELHKEGLLSTDKVVEAGRKSIIGRYIGETTNNAKRLFSKAHGKVLFIDEAYSLVEQYAGGDAGGYGKEAIDVIVEELGKPCSDRVVIMAGYPEEMADMLETNPGLKSRMNHYITFNDYSVDELLDILSYHVDLKKMNLAKGVREWLKPCFEKARSVENFGNGRFVVNLLEKAITNQRVRLAEIGIEKLGELDDEELMKLKKEDFKDVKGMLEELKVSANKSAKIGLS